MINIFKSNLSLKNPTNENINNYLADSIYKEIY